MSQGSDQRGVVRYEHHVKKRAEEWTHLCGLAHKVRQRLHSTLMFNHRCLCGGSLVLFVWRTLTVRHLIDPEVVEVARLRTRCSLPPGDKDTGSDSTSAPPESGPDGAPQTRFPSEALTD